MQLSILAPFAAQVAARLQINEAVAKARLTSLAFALGQRLEVDAEHAAAGLIARGVDDAAKLVAHGPAEQVLAAAAPEAIHPAAAARATLGGHVPAEEPASDDNGPEKDPSLPAGA